MMNLKLRVSPTIEIYTFALRLVYLACILTNLEFLGWCEHSFSYVICLSNVDNSDNNLHIFVSFSTANKPITSK